MLGVTLPRRVESHSSAQPSRRPVSPDQPAESLATLEPATSRWIVTATGRRARTVLVCAGIIAAGQFAGVRVDTRAYLVLAAWIGANFVMGPWASRPDEFPLRLRRYALTLAVDVLLLGAAYVFLDAAQWLGALFFMNTALIASATLPRRWAAGIAALIIVAYGGLVWLAVTGAFAVQAPFGVAPMRNNNTYAVAQLLSTLALLVILMRLQERLVQTIREAEQRYLLLVQSAPDMVMTLDHQGRFLYANPSTLQQTGYSLDELRRLPSTAFFAPEDGPGLAAAHAAAGAATDPVHMDVRYLRKDGETRWLQTRSVPFSSNGGHSAVLLMARDVTDEKRRSDELRATDGKLRMIVTALDIGFYTIDQGQRITSIFGKWAEGQDAAPRSIVGTRVRDFAPADVAEQHEKSNVRALAGENVTLHWSIKPPLIPVERFYRAHLAPMRDNGGDVVGVAGVWIDESAAIAAEREREILRNRVASAERMEALGKLVSGVAHELNNPLAAILNFTEDLLADPRPPDERAALEVILAQVLRSRTIVRDLLSFVRKGPGRSRRRESPGPILDTLILTARPGLAGQGVSFDSSVSDPDTPLDLDRAGFEQVVTNLLTNAAQAAGAGGSVRLEARRAGEWFEVVVEDNGPGIREEHLSRIFEPFFTTKPAGEGVGLGLSVSLGIVQGHGGELRAENRAAQGGTGARFVMRLPVATGPAPEPKSAITPGDVVSPARRASLLVIDDEESIRLVLRRFFERRGWMVDEARDGTDALVKLLQPDAVAQYDVVLCDLKMPGLSGVDLYRRVATEAPGMARRMILSSGDVTAEDVSEFLATVAVPVLEKPFELHALEALAERVRQASVEALL